jgi:hypothetical protein
MSTLVCVEKLPQLVKWILCRGIMNFLPDMNVVMIVQLAFLEYNLPYALCIARGLERRG